MSSPALRPVVALDVDGVLPPDAPGDGYVLHRVRVVADDVPNSPFVTGGGRVDLDVTVRINPAHGSWISRLREHADVVWATTWEHVANSHLAPLLGIDPLEVATAAATDPPRFGMARNGDVAAWKAGVLRGRYVGRPLVWVDDSASRFRTVPAPDPADLPDGFALSDFETYVWREPEPTLVVAPDPRVGLTRADMAAVEEFVAAHRP